MSESSPQTDTDTSRSGYDPGALLWLSAIASIVGLWVAVSPYVYDEFAVSLWNNVIVGLAVFVLAAYNFYRLSNHHRASVASAGLAALLGLWIAISPFVLPTASEGMAWSNVVSGAIIALVAGYNAYESRSARARTATGARM